MYAILQSKIFTFEKTNVGIVFFNTIPPKKKKELAIAGKLFLFLCSSAFANADERGLLSANILFFIMKTKFFSRYYASRSIGPHSYMYVPMLLYV